MTAFDTKHRRTTKNLVRAPFYTMTLRPRWVATLLSLSPAAIDYKNGPSTLEAQILIALRLHTKHISMSENTNLKRHYRSPSVEDGDNVKDSPSTPVPPRSQTQRSFYVPSEAGTTTNTQLTANAPYTDHLDRMAPQLTPYANYSYMFDILATGMKKRHTDWETAWTPPTDRDQAKTSVLGALKTLTAMQYTRDQFKKAFSQQYVADTNLGLPDMREMQQSTYENTDKRMHRKIAEETEVWGERTIEVVKRFGSQHSAFA